MPVKLEETRTDHRCDQLPPGVYALVAPDGGIAGYKVRWREEDDDGVRRNRAKRFSARKLGSLDRAREEALAYREAAVEIVERGDVVVRPDRAGNMTVGDLFKEWITDLRERRRLACRRLLRPGEAGARWLSRSSRRLPSIRAAARH